MAIFDRPEARSLGDMDEFMIFFTNSKNIKIFFFLIVKERYIARVGVCEPYGPVVYPLRVSF